MAQTPTKYELAINIKKALGLEMLAQVARRADSNKRTDVAFWPRLCEKSHGCYDSFLNRRAGATDVRLCGRD